MSIGVRQAALRIALVGFSDQAEYAELLALFIKSSQWQRPWRVVSAIQEADFVLVLASEQSEFNVWQEHYALNTHAVIAYSPVPLLGAAWHLRRPRYAKKPSMLDFVSVFNAIHQAQTGTHSIVAKAEDALATAPDINSRPPSISAAVKPEKVIKLLIVGNPNAGKTTAIASLSDGRMLTTEVKPSDQTQLHKQSTTVAMDYAKVSLEPNVQAHVYGAPGQRRFDFMSSILIHNAQGLIILINNAFGEPLKEVAYYLDRHRDFLLKKPAVIGITHNDLKPRPSISEFKNFLTTYHYDWPVLKVDARKKDDMLRLLGLLLEQTRINRNHAAALMSA